MKKTVCPLCGGDNQCCHNQSDRPTSCWCNQRSFPEGIFDLLPEEMKGKQCICESCLNKYISSH